MASTILAGGAVHDGAGSPPVVADVAIRDGRIIAVERLAASEAFEVIDVSGLAGGAGLHRPATRIPTSRWPATGRAESQVHQGVTTEVVGQCGVSCAPARSVKDIELMAPGFAPGAVDIDWRIPSASTSTHLGRGKLGVNVAAFVGHGNDPSRGAGRHAAPGDGRRSGGDGNPARAVGSTRARTASSTGLEYWPGSLATPDQLAELCGIAAKKGALYATHVRNRDVFYDLGFGEALATARVSGARLQVSHIQPKFGAPAHAMEHAIEMMETARRQGVDVACDVIPPRVVAHPHPGGSCRNGRRREGSRQCPPGCETGGRARGSSAIRGRCGGWSRPGSGMRSF